MVACAQLSTTEEHFEEVVEAEPAYQQPQHNGVGGGAGLTPRKRGRRVGGPLHSTLMSFDTVDELLGEEAALPVLIDVGVELDGVRLAGEAAKRESVALALHANFSG